MNQLLVNDDSRDIFDNEFIDNQNIIFSTVDNLTVREYLDYLSTFYNKIFIDSETRVHSNIY